MSSSADLAIREWTEALGSDKVLCDAAVLDTYARTTQVRGTRPACVLYPTTTEEVRSVVRIASAQGVVVYPISRGKNWGYGDACAPTEGAAIVDLSRMNRIIEVNTDLAYAVIEPGVSQQQLYEHLRDRTTGLGMDATGAGPNASLAGNTLDRGFGHTRYGDHVLSTCGMEVVLADGRVLNTGFGHYPGAKAGRVYGYGVGPSLDGLFCQSNLGIVTKLGIWLMPAPESFAFYYIRLEKPGDLAELVERLRPLRMTGVLHTAVHVANDLRLLTARQRYPWDEVNGRVPLPPAVRDRLRRAAGVSAWIACGSLTGTRSQVRGGRKALRKAVAGLAHIRFVDDRLLALGKRVVRALDIVGLGAYLGEQLGTLEQNYNLLRGVPTNEPVRGAQWRLRRAPDDPLGAPPDLGCGVLWISPVLPATGRDATTVMAIAEPILAEFGFDPLATFTMINERAMIAILNIAFDKSVADECAQADACYDKLVTALMDAGYIPYRTGPRGMDKLRSPGDVFWEVAAQLKQALDPHDIIARGRYIPPLSAERPPRRTNSKNPQH